MKSELLKLNVIEKYSEIAKSSPFGCCNTNELNYTVFSDDYTNIEGYIPEADLGLGCGLPTEFAEIKKGDKVLDLGSGAGNDCFIARSIVGEEGLVVGIDFTKEMLLKAEKNLAKTNYKNIKFVYGDIENLPFEENSFDVVISNCVLNLVPDKEKAYKEIYRVLNDKGHFSISDIVTTGNLKSELKEVASLYAGCISGALDKEEYIKIIKNTNFKTVEIKKIKKIDIPDNLFLQYISTEELNEIKSNNIGIYSITINGYKY
jgi:ubiquinone/menaquinone biosynthesis C-methylase UbiE